MTAWRYAKSLSSALGLCFQIPPVSNLLYRKSNRIERQTVLSLLKVNVQMIQFMFGITSLPEIFGTMGPPECNVERLGSD